MLVLLDRDGVLNVDIPPDGVTTVEALRVYPFAGEAVRLLKYAGFNVAVVTNQSAIGKGLLSEQGLSDIHDMIQATLTHQTGVRLDAFYHCPDHPDRATARRKPGTGMLLEALSDFHAEAVNTPFVGDDIRDMQAALGAGCPPYLVRTGKGEAMQSLLPTLGAPVTVCTDLLDAARRIILQYGHA